jgi:hypothetical protein
MEGPHPISPLNLNNSNHHPIGDIQSLKKELARINAELVQASEERAQAAEYGLGIFEEKQNLQIQLEELNEHKERAGEREFECIVSRKEEREAIVGREGRERGVRLMQLL